MSGHDDDQAVAFGAGLRHEVGRHLDALGTCRTLVLTTPGRSELGHELAQDLGTAAVGVFSKAAMHTPVEVTEEALAHLSSVNADSVLSAGGGSTIGLGKALALRSGVRQIALPTTYAGSECTPILGQTEDGIKTTLRDPRVRPDSVLYDPELVATLPVSVSITSALNAIAHAVEGLYADDRTSADTERAILGISAFKEALPRVIEAPDDLAAREDTLRGAWACGTVLARVGMALHHKLCHTLGGSFDLPHAETHAIILPHAVAYNMAAVPELLAPVSELFENDDPALGLWEFARSLGAPLVLADLGLKETDLERAADLATQNPYSNPRAVTVDGVRGLLRRAWSGKPPRP